ncbi:MAG: LPS assembly protein LptD [Thermoanaerobaculia bacterium]
MNGVLGARRRLIATVAPRCAAPPIHPSKKSHRHNLFRLLPLCAVLAVCSGANLSFSQSSFDTDPFAARFREKGGFEAKFKLPEKGGAITIRIDAGEAGGQQGKQTVVEEDLFTAEAPPGKFVTVEYQDIALRARRVSGSLKRRTIVAEGDVSLVQGLSRMAGVRLDLDLNDKVGVLLDGRVDLEGGLHLTGATLAKVGPKSFTLTEGTVTACDGADPAWKFSVRSGRVTLEDYARLKNATFTLGGIPLLWSPYILWPALRERASGFLVPGLGYNSNRGGYFGLSYYWAIGRSWDATFSGDFYTQKYTGLGAELRGQPSLGTKLEGTYYTIWDPTVGHWRWETQGKLVSDDVAPKVRGVVTWLNFSDPNFFQDFNRNFALGSTRSLKSEGFLTWGPDPWAVNLRLSREEAIGFGDGSSVVSERLPSLEARLRPTPLFGQAVFVEVAAQGGILHTDRGPNQPTGTYDRFDLFPQISAPLSLAPWLSLNASGGGRITTYGRSLSADGTTLLPDRYTREALVSDLQLTGPAFSRLFDWKVGPFSKWKHVLEPRAQWSYLAGRDNFGATPLFDEIDSLTATNALRYSLLQHLLAKGETGGSREIASFEIARYYYFRLPGEGTAYGPGPVVQRSSPTDFVLRVNAAQGLNFDGRVTWDAHFGQVTSASVTAVLSGGDRALSLSLFDSHPVVIPAAGDPGASAQLRVSAGTPILRKRLRFDVEANYDLTKGRMLESRSLLTLQASCFRVLAEYRDLRTGGTPSRDYRVALTLRNVGSFLDFTGSLP